jgi:hypothetical protein
MAKAMRFYAPPYTDEGSASTKKPLMRHHKDVGTGLPWLSRRKTRQGRFPEIWQLAPAASNQPGRIASSGGRAFFE